MPVRNSLSVWVFASIFVVSAAAMPLVAEWLDQPDAYPDTLAELIELLSQESPPLYVLEVVEGAPESGIYICTEPQPREQLLRLIRHPAAVGHPRLGRWQGVVHVQKTMHQNRVWRDEEIRSWGEYGMRIGPFGCFGDPPLLQCLCKRLLTRPGE